MKKMKKKAWACLMALAIALTMLPGMAVKAEAATSYDVWVGDVEVTSACTSGKGWSYDAKSKTLTLENFECRAKGKDIGRGTGALAVLGDLKLVLKGKNYIENTTTKAESKGENWNCGIYVTGTITISGDGSLEVSGGEGFTSHGMSVGSLAVNGGQITSIGKEAQGSSGIFARTAVTVNNGNLTATAKTSTAGTSRGIECNGSVAINGGKVNATAGAASTNSFGIQTNSMNINAGSVHMKGVTAARIVGGTKSAEKELEIVIQQTLKASDFTFIPPANLIYDGQVKQAGVQANQGISCGDVTVKYYNEAGEAVIPAEVGTYTVKIDVTENDEYKEVSGLTLDTWKFTVDYGVAVKDQMYTVSGMNEDGWSKDKVTIDAMSNYKIGTSIDDFKSSIILEEDTDDGVVEFYIKDETTQKIYKGTENYKIDRINPNFDGIADNKTYCISKQFKVEETNLVKVTDNEVDLVPENGVYTVSGVGTHTIKASDKAGRSAWINVIINGAHTPEANSGDCTVAVKCSVCGETVREPKAEHQFTSEYFYDKDGHWQKCLNKNCEQTSTKEEHQSSGAATEEKAETCTVCGYTITPTLNHEHTREGNLTKVNAVAATCTTDGNKEYYKCSCGQLFSDASAKAETSLEEVTVKASGHKYGTPIYTWNDDVTVCTASRKCDECDETENENANAESKVIQAQTCTNPEITARTATFVNSAFAAQTKNVQTKEAAGHTAGDWIVDKEPTVTIEGSRHKECTVCRTVLETEAIAKLPTPVAYKIIEGADGTYTANTDGTYTIRANGEFSKFVSVEMDGKVVDSKNYTAKSGSTIITFSKEYMSSLSAGKHTVKVNFTDGSAETTLTVAQKDTKDTGKTDAGKKPASKSAKTGDNSNLIAWFILLVASVCILGSLRAIRRQRRR